jgi:putative transposase
LPACLRYIELNLMRAGMCTDPGHYRWSSYRANALGEDSTVITPHTLYATLGTNDIDRRAAYRELFEQVRI